jgi:hypothetical protein
MSGWETFAIATGPAAVTALAGYLGGRQIVRADLAKMRAEKVNDRLQAAYVALVAADRERQYQPHRFTDSAFVREWNDTKFRPSAAATYLLGSEKVRLHLDNLMESHRREARDEPFVLEDRNDEREGMIAEMRVHLEAELSR